MKVIHTSIHKAFLCGYTPLKHIFICFTERRARARIFGGCLILLGSLSRVSLFSFPSMLSESLYLELQSNPNLEGVSEIPHESATKQGDLYRPEKRVTKNLMKNPRKLAKGNAKSYTWRGKAPCLSTD